MFNKETHISAIYDLRQSSTGYTSNYVLTQWVVWVTWWLSILFRFTYNTGSKDPIRYPQRPKKPQKKNSKSTRTYERALTFLRWSTSIDLWLIVHLFLYLYC